MSARFSYLQDLRCPRCSATLPADRPQNRCGCGSPLEATYDLDRLGRELSPADLDQRPFELWRYHELLPVQRREAEVRLGEPVTPLMPVARLGAEIGLPRLLVKDEGVLPTGTFKARGAAVGVSRARELGITHLAMPTNGNAGAAWAAYAAKAELGCLIVMPRDAPTITRAECAAAGAELYLVDGLITDAGAIIGRAVEAGGVFDVSTLKEPYRLEGKKTLGLEILEQMGWRAPDVILYPTGGGVGLLGIWKAVRELRELGWLAGPAPRLVAVQATGCAPIVRAWTAGARTAEGWPDAQTLAFGINVPRPLGDEMMLQALRASEGCAIAVDDDAILRHQRLMAQLEGRFICPEGAATVAAARALRASGWLTPDQTVLLINTGTGLKYPDTVTVSPRLLQPGAEIPGRGKRA
ncbi:MAG TPA: threonine synthase [Verrucomicrobiae bacterium]|nr:threonine synthase [Verrucomicrobiae bacterium]